VNPAAEQLFGWKAKELTGKVIEKALPMLRYASEKSTELSFTMKLAGHCKGLATMLDRERREVRVEISTSPIIDKESGFTAGVVSVVRRVERTDCASPPETGRYLRVADPGCAELYCQPCNLGI